jgi:hypothetical protein
MLEARLKAYVLFGGIDPAVDLAGDADALASAELRDRNDHASAGVC